MSDLSEKLAAAIKEAGYSHRELEQITGVPHSAIQRYASGTTSSIPLERLKKLAAALGKTAEYFLDWETKKDPDPISENEALQEIVKMLSSLPEDKLSAAAEYIRFLSNPGER